MDVSGLLGERVRELAEFSALLFCKRRCSESNDRGDDIGCSFSLRRPAVASYRRPSSENVPLPDVVRRAKLRMRRARRFRRLLSVGRGAVPGSSCDAGGSYVNRRRRPLRHTERCLLMRRCRRSLQRLRPTALRRRRRRLIALRRGKVQPPLCDCAAAPPTPAPSDSPQSCPATGGRSAVLWLPSHRQLCSRFHYRVHTLRVEGCPLIYRAPPRVVTVRVAVATQCQRKQHRVMQRWAARLPGLYSARRPSCSLRCKPAALPPPTCLVADRSHECVWMVQPRELGRRMSAEEVMDLLAMRACGESSPVSLCVGNLVASASAATMCGGPWPHEMSWHCLDDAAFYGYMWSFRENVNDMSSQLGARAVSGDLAMGAAVVVPVVLLRSGLEEDTTFCLVAAAPVSIGSCARRRLNIRLVSSWNPCGASSAACSVYEYWCCADAVGQQDAGAKQMHGTPIVTELIRERITAAMMRWRAADAFSSPKEANDEKNKGKDRAEFTPSQWGFTTTTVCVFPSLPTFIGTVDTATFFIRKCVMTVLLLSVGSPLRFGDCSGAPFSFALRDRVLHFQLARHVFASLTDTTASALRMTCRHGDGAALAYCRCRMELGYTHSVRAIGEDERDTLLRLVGSPAFMDISSACVSFQTLRVARLRCSLSNAHQCVLVKFALTGDKAHQREGSALFALRPAAPAMLSYVGVLTATSFFSMRFGCCVSYAFVWDSNVWGAAQRRLQCGRHVNHWGGTTTEGDTGCACGAWTCFFVSASEKHTQLLPFVCGDASRKFGCAAAIGRPPCSVDMRRMEATLCDAGVCTPVAVARLAGVT